MMNPYEFEYNVDLSKEDNFRVWYQLNCSERDAYGDPLLNIQQAQQIFNTRIAAK